MLSNTTFECDLSAPSTSFEVNISKPKVHQNKHQSSNNVHSNYCTLLRNKTFRQGILLWRNDALQGKEKVESAKFESNVESANLQK